MSRWNKVAIPAAVVALVASAALGAGSRFAQPDSTPASLTTSYTALAAVGDLDGMRTLAPPGTVDAHVQTLGEAWRARVEDALERAAVIGALQAYEAHLRFDEANSDARRAYYAIPYRERPDQPSDWMREQALAALSDTDKQFVYLDDDGQTRTWWNDVATAGISAWRDLSYSARRRLEAAGGQARFLAEHGAWSLPLAQRKVLVELGLEHLEDRDRKVLASVDFDAWADADGFVRGHGERLLSAAYQDAFSGSTIESMEVEHAPPEGRLFGAGRASVHARSGAQAIVGVARRADGHWRFVHLTDLDVDRIASDLRTDVEAGAEVTSLTGLGGAL